MIPHCLIISHPEIRPWAVIPSLGRDPDLGAFPTQVAGTPVGWWELEGGWPCPGGHCWPPWHGGSSRIPPLPLRLLFCSPAPRRCRCRGCFGPVLGWGAGGDAQIKLGPPPPTQWHLAVGGGRWVQNLPCALLIPSAFRFGFDGSGSLHPALGRAAPRDVRGAPAFFRGDSRLFGRAGAAACPVPSSIFRKPGEVGAAVTARSF